MLLMEDTGPSSESEDKAGKIKRETELIAAIFVECTSQGLLLLPLKSHETWQLSYQIRETRLLDPQNTNSPLTHGCLDSIANTADICQAKQAQNHSGTTMPTLECCHEDMCNYRGLHDVLSPPKGETSGQGSRYQHDNSRNLITKVQELTSSKELWFRAAVIAVPIAGGLILVLLIMLALRMLRSENKRLQDQRQQMLSRLHYSFHGHHSKKGQVAKLDLECMVPVTGHENCCMSCDKMRQTDLSNDKILSLVHWGMYSGHGKLEFV
ncbi:BMP and activin membrane-bound inhibitor like protein [Chelonia mydas]|uniref:BMP and activin membrane-bound inhibitor homolog n=1 Tax=Chelonia mydas TaxID=8469 RepID=M7B172_CHEMY|nr:BMP and activin membrane-bound inhibitor like protein [Chelonia mydas]